MAAYGGLTTSVSGLLNGMGASLLTARDTLYNGLQGPLPADQWQREVLHWHQTSMAKLQRAIVEQATGPSDAYMSKYVQKPGNPIAKRVCHSQVRPNFLVLRFECSSMISVMKARRAKAYSLSVVTARELVRNTSAFGWVLDFTPHKMTISFRAELWRRWQSLRNLNFQYPYLLCLINQSATNSEQKIRSTAFTSFSVVGLAITLTIGGTIILLAAVAEPLLNLVQRENRAGLYRRLEWVTNETLQLQRMAHEELGLGSWTRAASGIPVTASNECLGVLDISDENHPILARARAPSSPEIRPNPEVTLTEEKIDSSASPTQSGSFSPTSANDCDAKGVSATESDD